MNAKRTAAAIPLMPAAGPLMTGETIQAADLAVILLAAAVGGTAAGLPAAEAAAAVVEYKVPYRSYRCRQLLRLPQNSRCNR